MTRDEATGAVATELGGTAVSVEGGPTGLLVRCGAERIADVVRGLRDGSACFDYFTFMTAVDYPPSGEDAGRLDLHYHLRSIPNKLTAVVVTSIPRDGVSVRTVSDLFAGADWHERECYDLFGVVFAGHRNLTRILLPDDWRGHPLRKDYRQEENDLLYVPESRWPEMAAPRTPEAAAAAQPKGKAAQGGAG